MSRPRLLPIALLAALALIFAACGDDDDSAVGTEDNAESDGDAEDAAPDEDADDGGDDGGLDGVSGDLGECGFFAEFATAFEDVDPSEMFAAGEEVDFGSFFGPIAEEFQQVADAAPSEIQDQFHTVADGFSEVAAQLEGVVIDLSDPQNADPEALAALQSMETAFSGEFETASEEIDAWMAENCGELSEAIDLDSFGS